MDLPFPAQVVVYPFFPGMKDVLGLRPFPVLLETGDGVLATLTRRGRRRPGLERFLPRIGDVRKGLTSFQEGDEIGRLVRRKLGLSPHPVPYDPEFGV